VDSQAYALAVVYFITLFLFYVNKNLYFVVKEMVGVITIVNLRL